MKLILATFVVFSAAAAAATANATAAMENCDSKKLCYVEKQYIPVETQFTYTIYLTTIDGREKSTFRYLRSNDYSSVKEAESAAVAIGNALQAAGQCTYIPGWIH